MVLNKLSKTEQQEEERDNLIGLASFQERIEKIEAEIEVIKSMSLEEIQKKYWVDTMKEALTIFQEELDEVNLKLEDFKVENYKKEDYEND